MRWMPRMRMLLARRPWLYWSLVGIIAIAAGVAVMSAMGDVRRRRDAWGSATTVFVTTRDVAVGESLSGAVASREVPDAIVPPAALTEVPPLATATQRLAAGEIVVDIDVIDEPGPLALVPDGWVAIDVPRNDDPLDTSLPLFDAGDSAVVLADGSIVAERAIIVDVAADGVAVAVPLDDAARVAQAANQRVAVLGLSRP
jgi:hypothetical protein